jgi:ParB family chromosome partitioning protein
MSDFSAHLKPSPNGKRPIHLLVQFISIEDVLCRDDRRPVNDAAVDALVKSIEAIGLQTPITLRNGDHPDCWDLVAGRHRLEAFRRLGHSHIPAVVRDCTEVEAELWEIAENLHRCELTKEQRDAHIRRYAELLTQAEDVQSRQNVAIESQREDGRGHRPKGVASKIAEQTGLNVRTVQRVLEPPKPAKPSRRPLLGDKAFSGQIAELVRDRGPEPSRVENIVTWWRRDASAIEVLKIVLAHLKFDMPAVDTAAAQEVLQKFIDGGGQ